MLTTRVIPTSGQAFVGGIDVVTHPAVAKQLIGVVSQTNTLDRPLTVWENLYFHGRFFGMGAPRHAAADELLAKFRLTERAKAPVMALSGGTGPAADGGPGDPPPAGHPVPGRAHRRPRSAEPDRPVGDRRELHERGQTVVLTTHNMEEADQLCDRIGIMDRGRSCRSTRPSS